MTKKKMIGEIKRRFEVEKERERSEGTTRGYAWAQMAAFYQGRADALGWVIELLEDTK